jgi:hypothetical protein
MDILSHRGFDRTASPRSRRSPTGVPAVYHHFDSGEVILDEVVTIGGRRHPRNSSPRTSVADDRAEISYQDRL